MQLLRDYIIDIAYPIATLSDAELSHVTVKWPGVTS